MLLRTLRQGVNDFHFFQMRNSRVVVGFCSTYLLTHSLQCDLDKRIN